jgi:hypothetical protein
LSRSRTAAAHSLRLAYVPLGVGDAVVGVGEAVVGVGEAVVGVGEAVVGVGDALDGEGVVVRDGVALGEVLVGSTVGGRVVVGLTAGAVVLEVGRGRAVGR